MPVIPKAHRYHLEPPGALIENILKKRLEKVIEKSSRNII